jgi:putative ABC transport system permease protein
MDWAHRVRRGFDGVPTPPDDDVIAELAEHAAAIHGAARAEGCSQEEADRRVAAAIRRWREEAAALTRPARRRAAVTPPPVLPARLLGGLVQDLGYALRLLRREPQSAGLTVALLAIAIGATTALFSVAYGVLVRPLPWRDADRIVVLEETRGGNAARFGHISNTTYLAWRDGASTIAGLAAWSTRLVTLSGAGEPERIRVVAATATLFSVLDVRPLLGAPFRESDDAQPVVVVSEALWRDRFGADPAILGRAIELDGQPYTVVAVMPSGVAFPDRRTLAIVPLAVPEASSNSLSMLDAVARLRPGVTPAQAAAEASARGGVAVDGGLSAMAVFGSRGPVQVTAQPLVAAWTANVRRPLIVLLLAVALLLVAATASASALQLARTTGRLRELAVRAALGAGRARVTRQLVTEALLLGAMGGAAGIVLAAALNRAWLVILPADFPRSDDIRVDAAVMLFAGVMAVGASIACGLLPALRLRRLDLVSTLADDGSAPVGTGWRSRQARVRAVMQVLQVAVACVLLVGASLLARSFVALLGADRGFDIEHVMSSRLSMTAPLYAAPEKRFAIIEQALRRLGATPGVTEVAFVSEIPLTPGGSTSSLSFTSPAGEAIVAQASPRIVSPRYFAALRLRMLAGRAFSEGDTSTSEPVVVVNESFARRYLGANAVGSKIPMAGYAPPDRRPVDTTVIGVVGDVRYVDGATRSQPELYYSYLQLGDRLPVRTVTLLARVSSPSAAIAPAFARAVQEADGHLVADLIMPLEQRLTTTTLARPRLYAAVLGVIAGVALAIAGVGLFGVVSYSASQRSRELAIRVALGASRGRVMWLVLRDGVVIAVAGIVVGMTVAGAGTRLLATQLYGIAPHDLATFVGVPLLLLVMATAASVGPAVRAATLDPLRTLRGT